MSEKLCTLRTKGGGGGKYTETSLWTNPNPTTAISSALTVTLSDSVDNYKYIKLLYRYSTSDATEYSMIYATDVFKQCQQGTYKAPIVGFTEQATDGSLYARQAYYVSTTSVKFGGACYLIGSSSKDSTKSIPTEILGLNELDHGTKYTTNASEIAFKSVSANTIPTFTTVAEAKAIWLTINYASAYRALQITNVNPTTGEINNDSLYKIDTNSLGNIEPLTGNKFIVTSNSVTMQNAPSTAATQQSLIYTY